MAAGGVGFFATGYFNTGYWQTNYWAGAGAAGIPDGAIKAFTGVHPYYPHHNRDNND